MNKQLVDIIKLSSKPVQPEKTDTLPEIGGRKNIKAVLFDLYGTLMVSAAGDISISSAESEAGSNSYSKPFTTALRRAGFSLPGENETEDFLKTQFYSSIRFEHEKLKNTGNPSPEVDIIKIWETVLTSAGLYGYTVLMIKKAAVAYETVVNTTWPMPGLDKMLERLNKSGTITGIISNAQFYSKLLFDAYLGKSITEAGFSPQLCFWSYEYGISKPDPFLFVKAASVLMKEKKIPASEVLFVGNDMLNDIKPAAETGMITALFAGDRKSLRLRTGDKRIRGITPDFIITELSQISDILNFNSGE